MRRRLSQESVKMVGRMLRGGKVGGFFSDYVFTQEGNYFTFLNSVLRGESGKSSSANKLNPIL